jgi:type IV pilus assembly protein PilV
MTNRRGPGGARPRARRAPAQGRAGFSLVEVMMTIMLLAIGLLALAGLAGTALRTTRNGGAQALAAAAAQSRFDSLASVPCASIVGTGSRGTRSGTASSRGITERWGARDTLGGNMLSLVDTLTVPGRQGALVYVTMRACR